MSNLNTKFKKILEELEKNIQDSEKLEKLKVELFDLYNMEGDIKINCPYCNREIELEANELPDEVKCPDCNNVIELDWGACDCDEHNHEVGGCNGGCKGCEMDNNEDDM